MFPPRRVQPISTAGTSQRHEHLTFLMNGALTIGNAGRATFDHGGRRGEENSSRRLDGDQVAAIERFVRSHGNTATTRDRAGGLIFSDPSP